MSGRWFATDRFAVAGRGRPSPRRQHVRAQVAGSCSHPSVNRSRKGFATYPRRQKDTLLEERSASPLRPLTTVSPHATATLTQQVNGRLRLARPKPRQRHRRAPQRLLRYAFDILPVSCDGGDENRTTFPWPNQQSRKQDRHHRTLIPLSPTTGGTPARHRPIPREAQIRADPGSAAAALRGNTLRPLASLTLW